MLAFIHNYIKNMDLFPKKEECLSTLEQYINDEKQIIHPCIEIENISYRKNSTINKTMNKLYDAILENKKVSIRYLTNNGNKKHIKFNPYNFLLKNGTWYCVGKYMFRNKIIDEEILISNISDINIIDERFSRVISWETPLDIHAKSYTNYYRVTLIIQDRWDLFYVKFGR